MTTIARASRAICDIIAQCIGIVRKTCRREDAPDGRASNKAFSVHRRNFVRQTYITFVKI
jgi:hypothetical protein